MLENEPKKKTIRDTIESIIRRLPIDVPCDVADEFGVPTPEANKILNPRLMNMIYALAADCCQGMNVEDRINNLIQILTPNNSTNISRPHWMRRHETAVKKIPNSGRIFPARGPGRYSGRKK